MDASFQASVNSRRRRIVLGCEALERLKDEENIIAYLRTVAAAVVEIVHAPPAMTFLHARQFQIPTADRFTESWMIISKERRTNMCDDPIPCHRRGRCIERVG